MTDELIQSTTLEVQTHLFERKDHYTPLWMERVTPQRLRGEAERAVESLKRRMTEQHCAPIGGLGQIKVEWMLEAKVVAGVWPDDEAIQEVLPFEEFVGLMERSSPHGPTFISRPSSDDELADMVKAIDAANERSGGPGWPQGEKTGQPSTSSTDSTSTEQ